MVASRCTAAGIGTSLCRGRSRSISDSGRCSAPTTCKRRRAPYQASSTALDGTWGRAGAVRRQLSTRRSAPTAAYMRIGGAISSKPVSGRWQGHIRT